MAYCATKTVVRRRGTVICGFPLACNRWSCEDCSPHRQADLRLKARLGEPNIFLTLTIRNPGYGCPHLAARELVRAFRLIRRRAAAYAGGREWEYLWVFESTARGWPHLHILIRGPGVPQKLISEWADQYIGSPVVDIRAIDDTAKAAAYVTKYIAKAPERFDGTKRYSMSKGWLPPDDVEPEADADGWTTQVVGFELADYAKRCEQSGLIVVWHGLGEFRAYLPTHQGPIPGLEDP